MKQRDLVYLLLVTMLALAGPAAATDDDVAARVAAQLRVDGRGAYDSKKDPGRKPVETMVFGGIRSGMTALDMVTGSGYSAEILSAAVGPDGVVYAQNPFLILRLIGGEHHKGMMTRLEGDRLPNVRYIIVESNDMPFRASIDFVLWGLNLHDEYHTRGADATVALLRDIHQALKPGGILLVSDHVGVEGKDNAALHRIEPRVALDLIKKAGFVVEATSDIRANPDDDHSQVVFDDGIRYRTDQFLVRARKAPE